jgi:hypothetical protein
MSEVTALVKAASMAASRFGCKHALHLAPDVHSQPIAIYLLMKRNYLMCCYWYLP